MRRLAAHPLSFVSQKERKAVASDLKTIFQAAAEAEALQASAR